MAPSPRQLELRLLPNAEVRLLDTGAGKLPTIRGYAAVFNLLSQDLGGFYEVIRPGAFGKSLANSDVRALVDHLPYRIIGRSRTSAVNPSTLRMTEDEHGLAVEIDPPDTSIGRDTVESIRRGDVTGMSFGFFTITDSWGNKEGKLTRELIEVTLDGGDVSVVTYPAYPDTTVAVRSMETHRRSRPGATPTRDIAERLLLMADAF